MVYSWLLAFGASTIRRARSVVRERRPSMKIFALRLWNSSGEISSTIRSGVQLAKNSIQHDASTVALLPSASLLELETSLLSWTQQVARACGPHVGHGLPTTQEKRLLRLDRFLQAGQIFRANFPHGVDSRVGQHTVWRGLKRIWAPRRSSTADLRLS